MSSEERNLRICESSLPSSLLVHFVSTGNVLVRLSIGKCLQMMTSTPRSSSVFLSRHESAFRTTLEEIEKSDLSAFFLESLSAIMFSPNATVFELVFHSLSRHASNQDAASLLANHRIILAPSDPAVKTVTFIERICEVLTDDLSLFHYLITSASVPLRSLAKSTFTTIGNIWEFVASELHFLDHLCNLNRPAVLQLHPYSPHPHLEHLAKSTITRTMVSIIRVCLHLIISSPIPTPTTSPLDDSSIVNIHDLWSFVNNKISFFHNLNLFPFFDYIVIFISVVDVGLYKTNELIHTSSTLSTAAVTSLHHTLEIVSSGMKILHDQFPLLFHHSLTGLITLKVFPLVKTAITTCIELPSHLTHVPTDQKDALNATINSVLTMSWKIITRSLVMSMKSLHPILESLFVEGPDMFTLVEQISRHFNTNLLMDLLDLTNKKPSQTRAIFIFLNENMIERMFERVRPTAVMLTDRDFHSHVLSLIWNMTRGTDPDSWKTEERPFEPLLQFNRVVVPSQPYLLFVFQRDEYLATPDGLFESQINRIFEHIVRLDRELNKKGKDVKTGRESWEVGPSMFLMTLRKIKQWNFFDTCLGMIGNQQILFSTDLGNPDMDLPSKITTTTMDMLETVFSNSSANTRLALVRADLIPRLINTLNPLSLSLAEAVDIHTYLMGTIINSIWLASPCCVSELGIENGTEEQAIHETVFRKVLVPLETYIWHLFAMAIGKDRKLLSPNSWPFSILAPSRHTPSHSPLPLPHHPHPPTPLCLSLTTHTLPLPSASPSPPTPSHSPLPLPHHPHPPTPLCLSLTTHTLPLPSASPSPPTPSHSLCLSLTALQIIPPTNNCFSLIAFCREYLAKWPSSDALLVSSALNW
ncbi:hypothetical protein BLNAU_19070 [Blattamonas nauphoetae]|uniref:Uncharacterized protein n=1 Tax=Blattamonas nauphoetae TaxID=2049346 RepID=A0ABQ9X2K2_9EUKA|nr:hypothetical protein BLNAU_19070 [Blattamonas nauphoetae]